MNPKPKIFTFKHEDFNPIRVLVDTEPCFIGRDVIVAMGYKNLKMPIVRHVREEDRKRADFTINGTAPWLINEDGLIDLLDIKSHEDTDIRKLGYWFAETVLPKVHQICEEQSDEPADLLDDDTDSDGDRADGLGVIVIKGVHCYLNSDDTAMFNAEDVARGLGWTQTKNGVEYIRWDTINRYLQKFGFPKIVGKDDFILENMVYRLVWKSRDEKALIFQAIVADEILPSIRKKGYYAVNDTVINTDLVKLHDDIRQMYDLLYKISEDGLSVDVDELQQVLEDMIEAFDHMQQISDANRINHDNFERGRILATLALAMKPSPTREKIIVKAANLIAGEDFV